DRLVAAEGIAHPLHVTEQQVERQGQGQCDTHDGHGQQGPQGSGTQTTQADRQAPHVMLAPGAHMTGTAAPGLFRLGLATRFADGVHTTSVAGTSATSLPWSRTTTRFFIRLISMRSWLATRTAVPT